ncbi:hypothetical protein SCATT_16650 [Streptantibioticus cattleyicolor NRRL 8057 = DSM 46488]|uniref:Uncharacterized protein n=1 Tax=Streptantibioticus cattleyicolor (strain ATCC 35852 / DSM 46488 / JCM 4925 / NBRC 14057 / NRRL 8057) TaxID=1003195 RepID=G8WP03_STREN|nr:hypothetical protein SCATT_16650 [Streptantibioticus cattleyicolor NRRL 8057 = DSM 46488]
MRASARAASIAFSASVMDAWRTWSSSALVALNLSSFFRLKLFHFSTSA